MALIDLTVRGSWSSSSSLLGGVITLFLDKSLHGVCVEGVVDSSLFYVLTKPCLFCVVRERDGTTEIVGMCAFSSMI